MQDKYISDEELVAYLDGEDDLAPVAEIAEALKSDPALARRLDALRIDRDLVASSFAGLVPDDTAMPDFSESGGDAPRFGLPALATAASLALAIGLGAGIWLTSLNRSGWTDYVAAYQALYSNSTLAHIQQDASSQQAELDRVAPAIGKTLEVDALQIFPEAQYRRAQVLSFEGRALMQLAFTSSTGEPIALCIIRSDRASDADPRLKKMEGLSTAWWARDGYEYLLIGGTDDALISRIATKFAATAI